MTHESQKRGGEGGTCVVRERGGMVGEKGLGLVNKTSGVNTHRSSCRWIKRSLINVNELKIGNAMFVLIGGDD